MKTIGNRLMEYLSLGVFSILLFIFRKENYAQFVINV